MADLNKVNTPYAKFRDDLFGEKAQLASTFVEKILKFEPTKKVEYAAKDKLTFMDFTRADSPQLEVKKLIFSLGSEGKTNSGSDKIRLVSDTNALFTIGGGGLNYLLGKDAPDIFAPRIIIPSLQKQLIAEDPADKTKKVTLPEGFVTQHLRIGEGAIKLDAESIKNTITQLRNNVISALNTKEAADYEKSKTPKINPNPPA